MKQFNYLTALPLSFFSMALYRDIGSRWKGVGFAYLSILAFFSVVVTFTLISFSINGLIDKWAEETDWGGFQTRVDAFLEQTPQFIIDQDTITLSPEYEQPYFMYLDLSWAEDEEIDSMPLIMFDMDANSDAVRDGEVPILITSDKFIFNNDDKNRVETYYISEIVQGSELPQPFMVNAQIATQLAHQAMDWVLENKGSITTWVLSFYAICGLIIAFILNILYGIALGAIGVIIGFIIRVPVTFGVAFRLGCVALTPLVFLNIAMFYFQGGGFGFIEQLGIVTLYMLLAVYSCKGAELERG